MVFLISIIFLACLIVGNGQILIYNTENGKAADRFDCLYYRFSDGEDIIYCQRTNGSQLINHTQDTCDHNGEKHLFKDMIREEIHPSIVLRWNSSVDMTDLYAYVYENRLSLTEYQDQFICKCVEHGTFGKYCEYQLTHEAMTFSESISAQLKVRENGDSWDTQRYGTILCYETLSCPDSLLCLDWHEICDGVQRCSNGIDEENCDKLEFNECEKNEFRCNNGMCIPEEFWLDGNFDCMDWSDEYHYHHGQYCPVDPNVMECDDHVCNPGLYSCGDGQCIRWITRMAFQKFAQPLEDCFNKRNLNFMCEVSPYQQAWTLENGLCWPEKGYDDLRYPSWDSIHLTNLTHHEKCEYLFRCLLSSGFEKHCPCDQTNCTSLLDSACSSPEKVIMYPRMGLINANILIYFYYTLRRPTIAYVKFFGQIKCRGYHYQVLPLKFQVTLDIISIANANNILCTINDSKIGYRNFSSPLKIHEFCWNNSVTFNGKPYAVDPMICANSQECISQYRIRDGYYDCYDGHDEVLVSGKNYCTGYVGQHRFQCFNQQYKCLPMIRLGTGYADCLNRFDESWFGTGLDIRSQLVCSAVRQTDCYRLKEYIQSSSNFNESHYSMLLDSGERDKPYRMSFRHYCDTIWHLEEHTDELPSSCQHWVCPMNQYRCQTGQCIDLEWVCDGQWDCSDASDEESIFLIKEWLGHNSQLPQLEKLMAKCLQKYSQSPFHKYCNSSFEFGCFLKNVADPFNVTLNRPCINLNRIGDGIEDCYNAYDERNTFVANSEVNGMWGYHFQCGNRHFSYIKSCSSLDGCDNPLCSHHRAKNQSCVSRNDFVCLGETTCTKNIRCDGKNDCPHGEDEYWCASGTLSDQISYRDNKKAYILNRKLALTKISYPEQRSTKTDEKLIRKRLFVKQNTSNSRVYSYYCNRGITVLRLNEKRCLCPPAYYGDRCQYFSDRISIIAHIDRNMNLTRITNGTLKIKAYFLFNHNMIDQYEFEIFPLLEMTRTVKHRFYVIHPRTAHMLLYRRARYQNRSDIIHNHPYAMRFELYNLIEHQMVEGIGSWFYSIYFDYLPAFRLAVVLKIPSWFRNSTHDPCFENSCSENSICVPILNQNNSYDCACKAGYYGFNCSKYEVRCENYCSKNAFCRPSIINLEVEETRIDCICPSGYFGRRCHLKYETCQVNSCLNNGTCLTYNDPSGEHPSICRCSEGFFGYQCRNSKASVNISLNMTKTRTVHASVVQLFDITNPLLALVIKRQQIFNHLPTSIESQLSANYAPHLGFLKVYEDPPLPKFFLVYSLSLAKIHIISYPILCLHASHISFEGMNHSVPRVLYYHKFCQNNTHLKCFYDETYFCLCQNDQYRAECFINDIQHEKCDRCLSLGTCVQGDLKNPKDFICLCPFCHQGDRCELSLAAFGFTLDSLLVGQLRSIQSVYLAIMSLLFIVGLFNNACSFLTFIRNGPRKYGVGNYLLTISFLNQVTLMFLLFKFIHIISGLSSVNICKTVSYVLSVTTRSTYWLTTWITVERLLMIVFPTSASLKSPRIAICNSIITCTAILAAHIHEIIHYTSIQNISTGSFMCVTNFNTLFIMNYNRISTLIHHLVPFSLQIICITLLVILVARSRFKTGSQRLSFRELLKKQFRTQKELYVTPTIIILSALPQIILTFSFACTQLTSWQIHSLLISSILSYSPQLLGFILYVLPSTSFKNEFNETFVGRISLNSITKASHAGATIRKRK